MIRSKELLNTLFYVTYKGYSAQEIDDYLLNIVKLDPCAKYQKDGTWILSKVSVDKISKTHNIKNFQIEQIKDETPEDDYSDIGLDLKLSPFYYQKKVISYCLDKQKAIIVAPCGAGK